MGFDQDSAMAGFTAMAYVLIGGVVLGAVILAIRENFR